VTTTERPPSTGFEKARTWWRVILSYDRIGAGGAMTMTTNSLLGRINARLDERHAAKLEYLRRTTRMGVSDIVKRGIDLVYEDVQKETRDPFEVLTETGFIGSAEGPIDLSERYREELRELLAAKHGDR
jgi:hypothetical protein